MSEGTPLILSVILLFLVGSLLPIMVGDFVDFSETPEGTMGNIVTPMVDFVDDGISVFSLVNINAFGWLGDPLPDNPEGRNQVQKSMINYLNTWAYVPSAIAIPLLIIMFLSILYSIIKLLPTT